MPKAVRSIPLPGAPSTGVAMDFIAYDQAHARVWVPAGNTGSVDVIDTASGKVTRIEGFPTAEVAKILGSSEATVRSQISTARLKIRKAIKRGQR